MHHQCTTNDFVIGGALVVHSSFAGGQSALHDFPRLASLPAGTEGTVMGDVNQLEWVRRHIDRVRSPILEIGSKNYGAVSMDYRTMLAGRGQFVGTDME